MVPYFQTFLHNVLAKLTSKNQLTLPKSVTDALGPVQYFEVQEKAGQIVLTPVRIQRGDALRAKLAELAIDEKTLEAALGWSKPSSTRRTAARKSVAKPSSAKATAKPLSKASAKATAKPASRKTAAGKTVARKATAAKPSGSRSARR